MGKGDKKSRRGKITMGSYGVSRPRKGNKKNAVVIATPAKPKKETVVKKATAAKKETVAKKETAPKKVAAKKTTKKAE